MFHMLEIMKVPIHSVYGSYIFFAREITFIEGVTYIFVNTNLMDNSSHLTKCSFRLGLYQ
jgi:hypothetical protein